MQKTKRFQITPEGQARLNAHEAKLQREEHTDKFFTDAQQHAADAILWEIGAEITLVPKS